MNRRKHHVINQLTSAQAQTIVKRVSRRSNGRKVTSRFNHDSAAKNKLFFKGKSEKNTHLNITKLDPSVNGKI